MKYDLIVVGAGPAGYITAKTVAQAGYNVLVLERDAFCRSPCAGYVSSTINVELPEASGIQSKITNMRTYFPDLSFHDQTINGFVADRPVFDNAHVTLAETAGAQVRWSSPLLDLTPDGVSFRGGEASAKIIAGADGVFSKTASLLGLEKQRVASGSHTKCIFPDFPSAPQQSNVQSVDRPPRSSLSSEIWSYIKNHYERGRMFRTMDEANKPSQE
ncbi:MAG: Digeranylgeranylglycerophospholipid reductase [Candidatus Methanocomedens sp.]|nr:MAG: Digeranylgeranylglycerophospholipid reductase [ANME-2 cluster archaeon]